MEAFYTLQGEGAYQGYAAYFIRLGGCDVGCHWCDVKESWDAEAHPLISVAQLVEEACENPARLAVITGGEPAMYNLQNLTKELKDHGFRTHIETSGAYALTGNWDWVCLSPKKFKPPIGSVYKSADELKVIIFNKSDFQWAEQHASKVGKSCRLYLQPEWSRREEMLPLIIEYIKNNPHWQISLQVHKFMNIP